MYSGVLWLCVCVCVCWRCTDNCDRKAREKEQEAKFRAKQARTALSRRLAAAADSSSDDAAWDTLVKSKKKKLRKRQPRRHQNLDQ